MTTTGLGFSFAASLRRELSGRNRMFSKHHSLPSVESYGTEPVVVYEPFAGGQRHGNFIDASYAAILENESWRKRLGKVHTNAAKCLPKRDRRWMELDSSTSSDALLMNIFCYPGVIPQAAALLGVATEETPVFGLLAKVPLGGTRVDRTEIDMQIGNLFIEAKLTESDFQAKDFDFVERYRDFGDVFNAELLPKREGRYLSYQLIRNVLAAHANGGSICVLLDRRRPDLLECWYSVMCAVQNHDLRTRCKVLTWQELSAELPSELQEFLDDKYGIVRPGAMPRPVRTDGAEDFD